MEIKQTTRQVRDITFKMSESEFNLLYEVIQAVVYGEDTKSISNRIDPLYGKMLRFKASMYEKE